MKKKVNEFWYIDIDSESKYDSPNITWGEIMPYLTFKIKHETISYPSNLADCIQLIDEEINNNEE